MARLLVLLAIIAVTSSITGNEISEKVPLLFPRACGIHGWKKCRVARRRSHLQVTGELMHVKVPSHYILLKAQSTPHVVVVVFFFLISERIRIVRLQLFENVILLALT